MSVRRFLHLGLPAFSVVIAAAVAAASDLPISELAEIDPVVRDREKVAREVSGCTWHEGAMWVVDNEDDRHLLLMDPESRRLEPRKLPSGLHMSDLEGIASDDRYLYVMSGGGRDKKGRTDPRRFTLARLEVKGGRLVRGTVLSMLEWMKALARELDADLEKTRDTEGGKVKVLKDFKSEGLAVDGRGRLLVGLRKPLVKGRSAVVWLEGHAEAFDRRDPSRVTPRVVACLDLDGGGMSSLERDPTTGKMLVLSIPAGKLRCDLWTWDGEGKHVEHLGRLSGHKGEGVARIGRTRGLLLLADDEDPGGRKVGRYGFVDWPR